MIFTVKGCFQVKIKYLFVYLPSNFNCFYSIFPVFEVTLSVKFQAFHLHCQIDKISEILRDMHVSTSNLYIFVSYI